MARIGTIVALVLALGGCATSDDPVVRLVADLQSAGAPVTRLDSFSPTGLGGEGVVLCVAGQKVRLYVYETAEKAATVAAGISRDDPSRIGSMIVEWAGNPTFWYRDELLVLYLGSDPAVEAGLTSILGQPFASGRGRDPGLAAQLC